jgi:hypothetical protein
MIDEVFHAVPLFPLPCRSSPPSLSVSQERFRWTGRTEAHGRERRFPVFAQLVAAFPEIPEESKTAHFGRASPAGTRLAKPAVSPMKTSCSTPISLADSYQNHPHESPKTRKL